MFTSIVIVIVVIYVFGYAGMIIYDLFLKKEPVEFMPKPKDVDIDISDEAGQFKPITVGKDEYRHQPAAIQHSTDYKPDEGIATAQPHTDGQEKENGEGQKSSTASAERSEAPSSPPLSDAPFQSDNAEQEGKQSDDIEPHPTDAETKKRINEACQLKRREILAEEMTALTEALEDNKPNKEGAETEKSTSKDDSDEPTEDKTAEAKKEPSDAVEPYDLEVRFIGPEPTVSPEVSNAEGEELSKGKNPSKSDFQEKTSAKPAPAKKPRPPKPLKQPEFRSNAYFDILKVQIDDSKQQTKLQEPKQPSKSARRLSKFLSTKAQMTLRQINNLWEKKESERVLDEDELQAIKKSEESSREAPPEFNI